MAYSYMAYQRENDGSPCTPSATPDFIDAYREFYQSDFSDQFASEVPSPVPSAYNHSPNHEFSAALSDDHRPTPPYPAISAFMPNNMYVNRFQRVDQVRFMQHPTFGPNAFYTNGECLCQPPQVPGVPIESPSSTRTSQQQVVDVITFVTGPPLYYAPDSVRRQARHCLRQFGHRRDAGIGLFRLPTPHHQVNIPPPALNLGNYMEMQTRTTSHVLHRPGHLLQYSHGFIRYPPMQ